MQPTRISVYTKEDFRKWLKENHKKESKIAVVIHKRHTGKSFPTHRQLIEEAICFGWIDTTIKRLDEDTFIRHFSKRTTNSKWSDNTLSYAKQLVKEGRMSPEGLCFYKLGKARPTHDHGIPKNPDMPQLVRETLAKDPTALKRFATVAPSTKRTLYRWFLRAKGETTKQRRADRILEIALLKKAISPSDAINN